MKKLILMIALLISGLPLLVAAQHIKQWELGLSTEFGKDFFDRSYPSEYDEYPFLRRSFQSNYSWGAGIWAERHLNSRFSAIGRINYVQKDMNPDEYGEPSRTANKSFTKEKHHSIITDIGARWYLNPKSALKMFVDVKAGANTLIAIDLYEINDGRINNKGIFGYNHWQPVAQAAIGVYWRRSALSLEYNRDMRRSESPGNVTSILRQGLTVKTAFALIKL